jgi:glycine cleavage system H protein
MVAFFVVTVILSFLTIDTAVQRMQLRKARRLAHKLAAVSRLGLDRRPLQGDEVPDDIYLHQSHAWARPVSGGRLEIGADALLAAIMGEPEAIEMMPIGTRVAAGSPVATLRRGRRKLTLRTPVGGVIDEVNLRTADTPATISADPYQQGWIYRIATDSPAAELKRMLFGSEAARFLNREITRLRDALAPLVARSHRVRATLQKSGSLLPDAATHLSDQAWTELVSGFFADGAEARPK